MAFREHSPQNWETMYVHRFQQKKQKRQSEKFPIFDEKYKCTDLEFKKLKQNKRKKIMPNGIGFHFIIEI